MKAEEPGNNAVIFGGRVKRLREVLHLSQKDFAARIGIVPSYLSEIEAGKFKPGFRFFKKIASVFCVNADWLIVGRGDMFYSDPADLKPLSGDYSDYDFGDQNAEIHEMIEYFKVSPLVKISVMAFYSKFILNNESIIKKDIEKFNKKKNDNN